MKYIRTKNGNIYEIEVGRLRTIGVCNNKAEELEALETLKLLKDFILENNKNGLDRRFIIGSFDIIEKELKEYEQYKAIEEKFGIDLVKVFTAFEKLK